MLGLSNYLLGHLKEAIPYLEQVGNWSPNNVEIAYVLGLSYIQTQSPNKARDAFARMFNVPPTSASAYLINAQMMIRQQFEAVAEKNCKKRSNLIKNYHRQISYWVSWLSFVRISTEALSFCKKKSPLTRHSVWPTTWSGKAYTRQLKWDEAIAPLQKSIWLNRTSVDRTLF